MKEQLFSIRSVNISEKKGTIKKAVESIEIVQDGIRGDAHSGDWNRQISLLGVESVRKFEQMAGRKIAPGEFAENITTEGLILYKTLPLDRFIINNEIILEVSQIGKKCHGDSCAIFREVGNCVMPKEGIFCRVIRGGSLNTGMKIQYFPKIFKIAVITLSDRASKGIYEDKSGPEIEKLTGNFFNSWDRNFEITRKLIPDDAAQLQEVFQECTKKKYDLIINSGGTGISPRDITIETIKPLLDKEIPGIMEMIRIKYGSESSHALLSRSIAGVAGQSLVYCLPGSANAVREYMGEILQTLKHSFYMLHSLDIH
jgi:molybdopterin adenylyltransferase